MTWVDVEADIHPFALIAGTIGLACGAVAWWVHDFCTGFWVYLAVGCGAVFTWQIWLQVRLPREARQAARLVLEWFREQFPEERIEGVAVRAMEPTRYVIAVRHGFGKPTPRRYFAIARPALDDIAELPADDWWPRGLK